MDAKKTYQKPEIKEVELHSEEAVLTGCKKSGANLFCPFGATAGNCIICPLSSS